MIQRMNLRRYLMDQVINSLMIQKNVGKMNKNKVIHNQIKKKKLKVKNLNMILNLLFKINH